MNKENRLHIRRCHICEKVTECEDGLVLRCGHCGKAMAPFYFFDDFQTPEYSEHDLRPETADCERTPVRGLTAHW